MRLFPCHLLRRSLDLVRAVPERSAIAAEMPDIEHLANRAGFDQFVRFAMRTRPLQRPVDHERLSPRHRLDHRISFLERRCERLLDHDVRAERSDLLYPLAVFRCRRAQNDHVGPRFLEASAVIGEAPFTRDVQLANGFLHPAGFFITDAHKLRARMHHGHPQEIAHVKMVEVNAGNFPDFLFHGGLLIAGSVSSAQARSQKQHARGVPRFPALNRARQPFP